MSSPCSASSSNAKEKEAKRARTAARFLNSSPIVRNVLSPGSSTSHSALASSLTAESSPVTAPPSASGSPVSGSDVAGGHLPAAPQEIDEILTQNHRRTLVDAFEMFENSGRGGGSGSTGIKMKHL